LYVVETEFEKQHQKTGEKENTRFVHISNKKNLNLLFFGGKGKLFLFFFKTWNRRIYYYLAELLHPGYENCRGENIFVIYTS